MSRHTPGHYTDQDNWPFPLGVLIFMETQRRLRHGQFGSIPRPLRDWAFAEAGYCIDAPEQIPAGACEFYELDPTDMEDELDEFGNYGVPTQITVEREHA